MADTRQDSLQVDPSERTINSAAKTVDPSETEELAKEGEEDESEVSE